MKPDESLFRVHLESAPFLAGCDSGKWGLHGTADTTVGAFPVLWVRADKRVVPEGRVYLRFTIDNYPQLAPTACPWDINANTKLAIARWPKGGPVSVVFNPAWNNNALYSPCDRVALAGHEAWKSLSPQWYWQPTFTVVKYLEFVHVCLNPADHENT